MDFNEAVRLKQEHSEPYIEKDGICYEIFVVPKNEADRGAYIKEYMLKCFHSIAEDISEDDHGIMDDHAKEYSSDGQFCLWCIGKSFGKLISGEISEIET